VDITQASFSFRVHGRTLAVAELFFHLDLFHDGGLPIFMEVSPDVILRVTETITDQRLQNANSLRTFLVEYNISAILIPCHSRYSHYSNAESTLSTGFPPSSGSNEIKPTESWMDPEYLIKARSGETGRESYQGYP
jgi:hypothetical protein